MYTYCNEDDCHSACISLRPKPNPEFQETLKIPIRGSVKVSVINPNEKKDMWFAIIIQSMRFDIVEATNGSFPRRKLIVTLEPKGRTEITVVDRAVTVTEEMIKRHVGRDYYEGRLIIQWGERTCEMSEEHGHIRISEFKTLGTEEKKLELAGDSSSYREVKGRIAEEVKIKMTAPAPSPAPTPVTARTPIATEPVAPEPPLEGEDSKKKNKTCCTIG